MAVNSHPRAFFATQSDFAGAQQRADVLESDRSFVGFHAVQAGDGVNQMSGRDATRSSQLFTARFQQIIEGQAQNMIGLNEAAVAIEDAEAIRIAVSSETRERLFF